MVYSASYGRMMVPHVLMMNTQAQLTMITTTLDSADNKKTVDGQELKLNNNNNSPIIKGQEKATLTTITPDSVNKINNHQELDGSEGPNCVGNENEMPSDSINDDKGDRLSPESGTVTLKVTQSGSPNSSTSHHHTHIPISPYLGTSPNHSIASMSPKSPTSHHTRTPNSSATSTPHNHSPENITMSPKSPNLALNHTPSSLPSYSPNLTSQDTSHQTHISNSPAPCAPINHVTHSLPVSPKSPNPSRTQTPFNRSSPSSTTHSVTISRQSPTLPLHPTPSLAFPNSTSSSLSISPISPTSHPIRTSHNPISLPTNHSVSISPILSYTSFPPHTSYTSFTSSSHSPILHSVSISPQSRTSSHPIQTTRNVSIPPPILTSIPTRSPNPSFPSPTTRSASISPQISSSIPSRNPNPSFANPVSSQIPTSITSRNSNSSFPNPVAPQIPSRNPNPSVFPAHHSPYDRYNSPAVLNGLTGSPGSVTPVGSLMNRNCSDLMRSLAAKYNTNNYNDYYNSPNNGLLHHSLGLSGLSRGLESLQTVPTPHNPHISSTSVKDSDKQLETAPVSPVTSICHPLANSSVLPVFPGVTSLPGFPGFPFLDVPSSHVLLNMVRNASTTHHTPLESYLRGAMKRAADVSCPLDLSASIPTKRLHTEANMTHDVKMRTEAASAFDVKTLFGLSSDTKHEIKPHISRSQTPTKQQPQPTPSPGTTKALPASSDKHCYTLDTIGSWSVEDVCAFVGSIELCAEYVQAFREHRIDGSALPLLTEEHLTSSINMKLGPALKLRAVLTRRLGLGDCNVCVHCDECYSPTQERRPSSAASS